MSCGLRKVGRSPRADSGLSVPARAGSERSRSAKAEAPLGAPRAAGPARGPGGEMQAPEVGGSVRAGWDPEGLQGRGGGGCGRRAAEPGRAGPRGI